MTGRPSAEGAERASDQEIRAALEGLTEIELNRLHAQATYLARGLEGEASPEDLLQEAMTRTLAGDRRWNPKIHLVVHLMGTMKSVASHLKAARNRRGGPTAPIELDSDSVATPASQERAAIAADLLAHLEGELKDDEKGLAVLMALGEGLKGPEIQTMFNYTAKEIEAAKKRIRLRLLRSVS